MSAPTTNPEPLRFSTMSDRIARTNKMEALFAQMSAVLTALQDNSLTPLESEEILEELHDRCALLRAGSNGQGGVAGRARQRAFG